MPLECNRNVFHLEFNTEGTGLKYAIGEALGVHVERRTRCTRLLYMVWCRPESSDHHSHSRSRGSDAYAKRLPSFTTIEIDLFGKPPKSFCTDLALYATERVDKLALQFIGSPKGSSTFKKLCEKDPVAFADILQRYPSAAPPIEKPCELIGDAKPRHYGIASSQSVVGNRVDLSIVTVEWTTPNGKYLASMTGDCSRLKPFPLDKQRYGQYTRYLGGLKVGQKVTVSIKLNVMKV